MRTFRLVGIGIALMLMSLAIGGGAASADSSVTVDRAHMAKWAFNNDGHSGPSSGALVNGPGTPPGGAGSVQLTVANGSSGEIFMTPQFAGTLLTDITTLGYSTYGPDTTLDATLQFDLDYDLTAQTHPYQGRMIFEPYMQTGTVTPTTWETWNPADPNAKWWASRLPDGSKNINGACSQSSPCTLSSFRAAHQHAGVMTALFPGQFGFKAGSGWQNGATVNVANLVVGISNTNTTFNFAPGAAAATFHVRPLGDDMRCNGQTNADVAANTAPDCAFKTVQHTVDTALAGDTILVHGGPYAEQVNITKDLTLTGDGAGATTIQVPAAPTSNVPSPNGAGTGYALLGVSNSATLTMSGLTLNGPWPFSGSCGPQFYGIFAYGNGTVAVSDTTVSNIANVDQAGAGGCQQGVGIQIGRNSISEVGHATLTNVTVTGYQKNGITADAAGSSLTVSGSHIISAPSSLIASNGIQVSRGATGSITGNTISGNECNLAAGCTADPVPADPNLSFATGIILYNPAAGLTIQGNIITNNDVGIDHYVPATDGNAISGASNTSHKQNIIDPGGTKTTPQKNAQVVSNTPSLITGNTLTSNRYEGIYLDEGTATVSGNSITGGNIGVEVASFGGETGNAQGTLSQNEIKNAVVAGIQLQLDPTATFLAKISGDSNSIHDNAKGVNNTTTTPITMTNNYWGTDNGPANPANTFNVGTQGNSVSANVNFVPWWKGIGGSVGSFTGTSFAPVTNTTPAGQFASIQAAVTASSAGGTVNAAAGTFTEQVSITKDLTLTGSGSGSTTVKTPATLIADADGKKNIVEFRGSNSNTMSGFTVSGPVVGGCGGIDTGIAVLGSASLNLSASNVSSIRAEPFQNCQDGEGIHVGTPRHSGTASVGHLTATTVAVTDFDKNGVVYTGAGTGGSFTDSTITAAGPTISAQNGLEVIGGAIVTVTHNTVSNIECNAASCGPDPLSQVYATGISTTGAGTGTIVQNNTVHDTDVGIDSDGSGKTITGNVLTNNRFESIFLYQGSATLSGNTITGGRIGVEVASFGAGNSQTGAADTTNAQGTLTNNTISGTTVADIQLQDQDATDTFVPVVTGTGNKITGTVGVNNTTTSAANLANNWWGSLTGPTNANNVGGTGSSVTSNVTFTPWCGNDTCTIHYGIGTKLVYTTQPAGGPATAPLATQPVLQAEDASGNLGINFAGPVALALGVNPSSATLGGATTVNAVSGVATFTNVSVSKAGTGDTLVASSGALTPVTSNPFTVGAPIPTVSAMDVTTGTINGGTTVVITGTNFVTGDTVTFGGLAATNVQVLSGTQISVKTPAHAEGLVDVRVVNASNQGNTLAQQYHYITSADVSAPTTRGGPISGQGGPPAPAPAPRPLPVPNPHP
ncbi:MAG: beta strand repeat-containing protein [Thermomicrobiales bacterium]